MALDSVATGYLVGLSLAAPPGPIVALLAREATRRGWTAGFLVGFGAMVSDAVYLGFTTFGALAFLGSRPRLVGALSLVGAGLMLWLAWGSLKLARGGMAEATRDRTTFWQALAIGITNPYQFAWWFGSGAPLVSRLGPLVAIGFFAGILSVITVYPTIAIAGERRFRGFARVVSGVSAVVLAGFAAWFVVGGVTALRPG